MFCVVSAWNGHTEQSRIVATAFVRALAVSGLKHGSAADQMGLDEKRLGRALAGAEPLNLWRVASLPASFWLAFLGLLAAHFGASLLLPEHVELLRGAARLFKVRKRMARMALSAAVSRRSA